MFEEEKTFNRKDILVDLFCLQYLLLISASLVSLLRIVFVQKSSLLYYLSKEYVDYEDCYYHKTNMLKVAYILHPSQCPKYLKYLEERKKTEEIFEEIKNWVNLQLLKHIPKNSVQKILRF